jgi:quercetin dioxygenase-like cupin family protein
MKSEYRIEKWDRAEAPNGTDSRIQMESEGYRVFEWGDRAGVVYAPHEHPTDQTHCVVSGKLEITIEEYGTVVLGPGDRDFMPAGTRHSARVVGDKPVIYLIGSK